MFNLTFEIVTRESAEHGGAAESGFVGTALTLREAADALRGWGGAHSANVWPLGDGSSLRWLTFGDDDSALLAYLARLEADERIREFSEEY